MSSQDDRAGSIRNELDVDSLSKYIGTYLSWIPQPLKVSQFSVREAHIICLPASLALPRLGENMVKLVPSIFIDTFEPEFPTMTVQSNPTYLIEDVKKNRYVMRKKPPGKLISSKAHSVEREYAILSAVKKYNELPEIKANPTLTVPVPNVYILCTDTSVVGSSFYIMEFLKGRIYADATLPAVPAAEREEYWLELVRTQAKLARIDPSKLPLPADFAPPAPYYIRQTGSLAKLARRQGQVVDVETREEIGLMPGFDDCARRFQETMPKSLLDRAMTHGDLKMDNVVYHPTEPRVIGILDWELCTAGSPTVDFVGGISPYFIEPEDSPGGHPGVPGFLGKIPEGLPSAEKLWKVWLEASGCSVSESDLYWAIAWGYFRGSVIAQGIAARYAVRQASNARAWEYGQRRFLYMELTKKYLKKFEEGATL